MFPVASSVMFFSFSRASATDGPYRLVRMRLTSNDLTVHLITAI